MSSSAEKEEKPTIHLKMKVGNIEFEIECREDQVRDVVEKVLSTVSDYASKPMTLPLPGKAIRPGRSDTCRGVIEGLWKDGWFSKPRTLGDVHNEMMRIGYHYDRTAVAHVLLDLVRDGILTREGSPSRYSYTQKRPPSPK